jgi:hypothetical protein
VGFRWKPGKSPSEVWGAGARRYADALDRAIAALLDYWCPQIERDAKMNATWTDRTGNARQTLACFHFKRGPRVHVAVLKQHMDYGKWLELSHGGKYQIVMPTLETYYQPVWKSVKDLLS